MAKAAVLTEKGDQVVYVANGNVAERRIVDVGFTDDEHTEIQSGVVPGESVVIKGQRSLKHGYPLKILRDDRRSPTPAAEGLGS